MKKILTALTAAFALSAFAGTEIFEIQNDNTFDVIVNWWCKNQAKNGAAMKKAPGGRAGTCMHITNTEKGLYSLFSRALIPVSCEGTGDTVKMSFRVKGKGTFRMGFYVYDENGRNISTMTFAPTTIDSNVWIKKDYALKSAEQFAGLGRKKVYLRISMTLNQGAADLFFDDFSGVKESVLP